MGVETILLIVILAFAAGFVLDRLAMRTPSRRRKVEDETVIGTSPTRPSSALANWLRRIPVRRGKPRPARPCQPNWRAGALVPRFPLTSGCGHDASFARAPRGLLARRPWLWPRGGSGNGC